MSVSGLTLEEARHRINAWVIDDWPWRIILASSANILLSSRGSLRWRTDELDLLEFSWGGGMPMGCGSIVFPFDESVTVKGCDPVAASAAYPEFPGIGGPEARYSDCLEISFSFGRLLLLRFDMSMFDPPDSDS